MSEVEVGGRIDGKYEVLGHIGGGGMGEVYRVRHLHLDEQRVIKVMRPDLARSQEAIDRFSNEARLATKIKHPSVATLHDFSRLPDDSFYMVWEHIEGQDVEGWLQRRGRFPLPIAIELAIQVLSGLEAIHEEGIVHRDLSPDNLMITNDPRGRLGVKIIDLGLADQVTPMGERSGQVGGKMNYCSPEHLGLFGETSPDQVSDLYSFAIVLYRMLTGVLPFPKAETAADVAKREHVPARALSLESVHNLMRKALAYERRQRFQAASEFRQELVNLGKEIENQQQSARAHEGRIRIVEATDALNENRLVEAEALLVQLETSHHGLEGVSELRSRLNEMNRARKQVQIMQVREMVEQYLASKQQALARLSLESLLELDPDYRDKETLTARLEDLDSQRQESDRAVGLLAQGRKKVAEGDLVSARALHSQLSQMDPKKAAQLGALLESQVHSDDQSTKVNEITLVLESILDTVGFGALEQQKAEAEIDKLKELGVANVTCDLFSLRLNMRLKDIEDIARASEIRRLYPEAIAAGNWNEARQLINALQVVEPESPDISEKLIEIDHGDQESRRKDAVSEGVSTLTSLLDSGRLEEARMALTVMLRMNGGDHPLKGHFESRIEQVAGARK